MTEPVEPEDVLPGGSDHLTVRGTTARKGSVAAFVRNAQEYVRSGADDPRRADLLVELRRLAPTLKAIGVFDVFDLRSQELRAALEPLRSGAPSDQVPEPEAARNSSSRETGPRV